MVILFELANTFSFIQNLLNNSLDNDILNFIVTAYVDNILVFSITFQEYKKHVKTVLAYLQAASLKLDLNQYKFEVYETKYLNLIIQPTSSNGCPGCVKMCPVMTNAIDAWKSLKSVKDIPSFLGFTNFYQSFIKDFAKLATPLTTLIRKNKQFQ